MHSAFNNNHFIEAHPLRPSRYLSRPSLHDFFTRRFLYGKASSRTPWKQIAKLKQNGLVSISSQSQLLTNRIQIALSAPLLNTTFIPKYLESLVLNAASAWLWRFTRWEADLHLNLGNLLSHFMIESLNSLSPGWILCCSYLQWMWEQNMGVYTVCLLWVRSLGTEWELCRLYRIHPQTPWHCRECLDWV